MTESISLGAATFNEVSFDCDKHLNREGSACVPFSEQGSGEPGGSRRSSRSSARGLGYYQQLLQP